MDSTSRFIHRITMILCVGVVGIATPLSLYRAQEYPFETPLRNALESIATAAPLVLIQCSALLVYVMAIRSRVSSVATALLLLLSLVVVYHDVGEIWHPGSLFIGAFLEVTLFWWCAVGVGYGLERLDRGNPGRKTL
jgi:hypothetical protein